jgi:hypothetical protein
LLISLSPLTEPLLFSVSKPRDEELERVISHGWEEMDPGLVDPYDE